MEFQFSFSLVNRTHKEIFLEISVHTFGAFSFRLPHQHAIITDKQIIPFLQETLQLQTTNCMS